MKGAIVSYVNRFVVGQPINNLVVAEVITSKNPKVPVGSIVVGFLGWEEYTRVSASNPLTIIEGARESKIPLSYYVGVLGMPVRHPCHIFGYSNL